MKYTVHDVARSLLHTCRSVPIAEQGAVVEAAFHVLRTHGLSKAVRTFPRVVQSLLEKEEGMVFAQITTPDGTASAANDGIVAALEKSLHQKKVHLTHAGDTSLIGGAMLSVGDERFDASVRGALDRFRSSLSVRAA